MSPIPGRLHHSNTEVVITQVTAESGKEALTKALDGLERHTAEMEVNVSPVTQEQGGSYEVRIRYATW